jgi:hypothetical protein
LAGKVCNRGKCGGLGHAKGFLILILGGRSNALVGPCRGGGSK